MQTMKEPIKEAKCWYCGRNNADKERAVSYNMHKLLKRKRSYVVVGARVKSDFLQTQIEIPRCKACASVQEKLVWTSLLIYAIMLIVFFVYVPLPREGEGIDQKIIGYILSVIFGIPVFLMLNWLIGIVFNSGMKSENSHPKVIRLLDEGWELGNKPNLRG